MTDNTITITDELREAVRVIVSNARNVDPRYTMVKEAADTIAAAILPPERKVIDVMAEAAMAVFCDGNYDWGLDTDPDSTDHQATAEAIAAAIDAVPVTDALLNEVRGIVFDPDRATWWPEDIVAAVKQAWIEGVA